MPSLVPPSLGGQQPHTLHTLEFRTHLAIYTKRTVSIYLYSTV